MASGNTHDAPSVRPAPRSALVIGVGNDTRGDDAAGLVVARRLRKKGIPNVTCTDAPTDALSLIGQWDEVPLVVVVDAASSGAAAGTVHRIDALQGPLPCLLRPMSSHGFGVIEVIELARALGRLPSRLLVYGIEGENFEPGARMSPAVHTAIESVTRFITVDCVRAD